MFFTSRPRQHLRVEKMAPCTPLALGGGGVIASGSQEAAVRRLRPRDLRAGTRRVPTL